MTENGKWRVAPYAEEPEQEYLGPVDIESKLGGDAIAVVQEAYDVTVDISNVDATSPHVASSPVASPQAVAVPLVSFAEGASAVGKVNISADEVNVGEDAAPALPPRRAAAEGSSPRPAEPLIPAP
jgi:hypothetical protein